MPCWANTVRKLEEMTSKEIRHWSDDFMFEAESIDPASGPEVFLINCNNDPLGSIAAAAKAYMGEFVESLAEITDGERRHYLEEVRKTALAMPMESVNFHFRIKGVTRGFTHQMVRQRTAAYSQESTRFAVKTSVPVGLPPSLIGTTGEMADIEAQIKEKYPIWKEIRSRTFYQKYSDEEINQFYAAQDEWNWLTSRLSKEERWRGAWDKAMSHVEKAYNYLVDDGMPAEDARGMLPTNLLTQLNYFTNLRNLQAEAGKRLCTQAQFEWRIVLSKLVEAIRDYGKDKTYLRPYERGDSIAIQVKEGELTEAGSYWQFEELANIFRPVCYLDGKCPFKADFDRKCSIRERVDKFADNNIPSSEWDRSGGIGDENRLLIGKDDKVLLPIHPQEWLLDPAAAR